MTSTPTPSWLYYLFGVALLVVAGYCVVRVAVGLVTRRTAGWDVDVSHVLMGVSMAGMFVPAWAFGPSAVWQLIFGVLFVWFVVRSIQSVQRWGLHLPHALIHAVMSLAMLLMYWYPMSTGGRKVAAMSMTSSPGPALDPAVGLALALVLLGSAVFTLASPVKGTSHYGRHVPAYPSGDAEHPGGDSTVAVAEEPFVSPVVGDVSHVVMCVGMGFMLVLML